MGLDWTDILMECEAIFGITLPQGRETRLRTAGELYLTICVELKLQPVEVTGMGESRRLVAGLVRHPIRPWNSEDVWATLVDLCAEQLGVDPGDVKFNSRFVEDLGL